MTFDTAMKKTQKLLIDNSPTILTMIGVTGTLATAYLTGKASFRAAELLRLEEQEISNREWRPGQTEPHPGLTGKEKFELLWKLYIPAASMAFMTCASIVAADRIGTRRAAALAAAYSLSERAYVEYVEKVEKTLGKNKAEKVRAEIAQDRVNDKPPSNSEVIVTGEGDTLCYMKYTGRYFRSNMETIKAAQNRVNWLVNNNGYASLNDFHDWLSLDHTDVGEEVGWNSDELMDCTFPTTLTPQNVPCLVVDFSVVPIRSYWKVRGR